jgi:hypothetical protein
VFDKLALGIRNYYDLLRDHQKQRLIQTGSLIGLLDFYQKFPPSLSIWDAFHVGEGQGPFRLKAQPYHLILSSDNLLAGDSIMAELMGFELPQSELMKHASENNMNSREITVIGEPIAAHRRKVAPARISAEKESDWFEIIQGTSCPGCQTTLRYLIDFLFQFIQKDLQEFGGFSCFIGEIPSDLSVPLKKGILLFGKCAHSSISTLTLGESLQENKFFFSFPGCPPLSLRSIESFCLEFKEWLPSLEIIEEFIRKWTKGRQYKIPTADLPLNSSK